MNPRNRLGLYGAYFLGMSGIGFTLPFLPLYLGQEGMSDRAIGIVSTLAALAGLIQFPLGIWSDRIGRRKPFLIGSLAVLAAATILLPFTHGVFGLGVLVILFAENGACRATIESFSGAEAAHLAGPGEVGRALGALRFWRPASIIVVALGGGLVAEFDGVGAVLWPLALLQGLAVLVAFFIHDDGTPQPTSQQAASVEERHGRLGFRDPILWVFAAAMVLFHIANAPGGVYLGLFLTREFQAPTRYLSYAFAVSMIAWMLVVRPVGFLADRMGRKPLLIVGWAFMSARLALIAMAGSAEQILVIQIFDGLAPALFAVAAAAWVTDRLADPGRVGEAQVLVGSSLVFGSAVGPLLSGLVVEHLGYRSTFGMLAGIGAFATALVILFVPETLTASVSATGATGPVSPAHEEVKV